MRRPKSRPSSSARSCSNPIRPSMRRLSSSSCASRPGAPTDRMTSEMTMAMMTTTTKISTSVKPLLRIVSRATGLFLFEGRGADVRVVTLAAGLAVSAVGGDLVIAAVGARAHVLIGVVPRVLGQRTQVAAGAVIGDGRIGGLFDQSLQSLLRGRVFEVVQPVQVQGGFDRPNIALRAGNARLVDIL